jgi:hypothetical protein
VTIGDSKIDKTSKIKTSCQEFRADMVKTRSAATEFALLVEESTKNRILKASKSRFSKTLTKEYS